MSGPSMAEVLAGHPDYVYRTTTGWECVCGAGLTLESGSAVKSFATHQADALTAAGFGDVRAAGAEALEMAADELGEQGKVWYGDGGVTVRESPTGPLKFTKLTDWLRASAKAVRGEG